MNKIKIPINTTWSNCELIYHADEDIVCSSFLNSEFRTLWDRYISSIGGMVPKYNVWFDREENILFGSDLNWINSTTTLSSFITKNSLFETDYCKFKLFSKTKKYFQTQPLHQSIDSHMRGECFYDFVLKEKERVLVFSGGPSSREFFDKVNFSKYDSIVTCNHFFKSDLLSDEIIPKIEYAILGREVNVLSDNKEFHTYIEKSNTKFLFEVVDDGSMSRDVQNFNYLKSRYPNRVGLICARYRSKIGTSPRLMVLASSMKPKQIDVIGMDGMRRDTKKGDLHNHAFQKGKKYNQTSANFGIYKRNYVELWDYTVSTLSKYGEIAFTNLGEGHPNNQSTEITSSKIFSPS